MGTSERSFRMGDYRFAVAFDKDALPGGEWSVSVFSPDKKDGVFYKRTFYFANDPEMQVHTFASQFVKDSAFREECLAGTVRWARIENWYRLNAEIYIDKLQSSQIGSQSRKNAQTLYTILDKGLEALEKFQDYHDLLAEEIGLHTSPEQADPEMVQPVVQFNELEKVKVRQSCAGIRRSICLSVWGLGPIWLPSKHSPRAVIEFERAPVEFLSNLAVTMKRNGLGDYDVYRSRFSSASIEKNQTFIEFLSHYIFEYTPEVFPEVIEDNPT